MRPIPLAPIRPSASPETAEETSAANEARPKFSQELAILADTFADRPARLAELLETTRGRGFDLLLVCISLPFLTPLPLPGLSTPFGLVVAVIGARLAMGRKPWLPQRLLAREMPPQFLSRLLKAAGWFVRLLEHFLRPRLCFLQESLVFRRVAGVLITVSGVLLLLPLPLPLTNSLPAITIILLATSALERDGVFLLAGCFMFLVTVAFFGLLAFGGVHVVDGLIHKTLGG